MIERLVDLLITRRQALLTAAVIVAGIAAPLALNVQFDRSVENMFARGEPLLDDYQHLQQTFGGNEIVLLVYRDEALLTEAGLARLTGIRTRCESVPGVRAVLSVDRPLAYVARTSQAADRLLQLFENYTHSADGTTAAVVCMLDQTTTNRVSRREIVDGLRAVAVDLPDGLPAGVLAGEPVMILDGFRYLERDGRRLGIWSTVLLGLTILICFRSFRWVVIAIAVVQWTLLCTKAILVASGLRLSMVSSMLTAIVTVVGVATVVHLIVRIQEGRFHGKTPSEALRSAGVRLAAPIFWACATDAVGFISLAVARVGPIQDFGIMMAIGALLVLPAVAMLVPCLSASDRFLATLHGSAVAPGIFESQLNAFRRRPRIVLGVTTVMVLVASIGLSRLQIETDFSRNFRSQSPIVKSYRFIEEQLGGAGVLDIILPAPKRLNWEYLDRVSRLEDRLRKELVTSGPSGAESRQLTKVLSIADAIAAASPINLAESPQLARDGLVVAAIAVMGNQMPDFALALYHPAEREEEGSYLRIMLRAYERQPAEAKLRLVENIKQICDEEFPAENGGDPARVTGFFVLLANLVASVLRDQWTTFGIAAVGIAIMLTLAFRSLRYAAIAVVPNSLPILFVLGSLGWAGGRVNMGVAMIAAVSLGLSIDSAIHYITFFRRARQAGKGVEESISEVQETVGRAVLYSTLALIIGFSVMCTSEFVPTAYFGFLVSISMLGGLLGNLVLLPILLSLTETTA